MSNSIGDIKLGQAQAYVERYDPSLLLAVPRLLSRQLHAPIEFFGVDIWTAYELSWLNPSGKPQVALAEFTVPASSPNLIESKSFKYYLNSFNQTQVSSWRDLHDILVTDLSRVAGAEVAVKLIKISDFYQNRDVFDLEIRQLDALNVSIERYQPDRELLCTIEQHFSGVWCSHLLKSNCPVTGQPDWASVWIGWQGRALCEESLLRYIVSYRQHQDFHENCVEQIYSDLWEVGQPENLWVYARYTRRGGLDINPFRSKQPMSVPKLRAARQ